MWSIVISSILLGAFLATRASPTPRTSESHTVQLVNNCGKGTATFRLEGSGPYTGDTNIIQGPALGGIAWVSDAYGCEDYGQNCGVVEFSLQNPTSQNDQASNAAAYDVQESEVQMHEYKYEMDFALDGCQVSPYVPGPCSGNTPSDCPGAFPADEPVATPFECTADNVGIVITFC
ncbi:hypothetical protein BD324DRAFT_59025 [Kockovaella imperatae]|uniref:Glycopeptide n=1 Tax=Kockovaella imperatae TaxID=4999 RepID=A0A1Y1UDD4_9TREE|nr:hypothetical protein BD324DRAFT_59025 [Kockovaella imperatae]ORX35534.1 hypothetical protein BD324DRAFT_59025 [Kockovaella imperatae]